MNEKNKMTPEEIRAAAKSALANPEIVQDGKMTPEGLARINRGLSKSGVDEAFLGMPLVRSFLQNFAGPELLKAAAKE